jgi:hypothetical protein
MHKKKNLGMSHKGPVFIKNTKKLIFWEFSLDIIFKNTSNANLFDVFYR